MVNATTPFLGTQIFKPLTIFCSYSQMGLTVGTLIEGKLENADIDRSPSTLYVTMPYYGYNDKSSNGLSNYFKEREYSDKEVWILGIDASSVNGTTDHL